MLKQNLTELTNFPPLITEQISRDHLVRKIASNFSDQCRCQLLEGDDGAGKTNTLAQFANQFCDVCISYFITDDPRTHDPFQYLLMTCRQMSEVLGRTLTDDVIEFEKLKSLFTSLCIRLGEEARKQRLIYYFVIDGIDRIAKVGEGNSIIDLFPQTLPRSPYLLISSRTDNISLLPSWLDIHKKEQALPFSVDETKKFLNNLGFSGEAIVEIHNKHNGNPGALNNIRQLKLTNPDFSLDAALTERERIIEQKVVNAWSQSNGVTQNSLIYLAYAPVSLPIPLICNLVGQQDYELLSNLRRTGLVQIDDRNQRILISRDTAAYLRERNSDSTKILDELISCVRLSFPNETLLLTLLIAEAKDYDGLIYLLEPSQTIATIQNTSNGVATIFKRLHIASGLAKERGDTQDFLKWTLAIAIMKSYTSQAIDTKEIEALIAIGESKDAIRKAYAVPDLTNKIRLLARAYAAMEERDENISTQAKEELAELVNRLGISDLDTEVVQDLAVDLFPILPDRAVAILENLKVEENQKSVIDIAAQIILSNAKESDQRNSSSNTLSLRQGLSRHLNRTQWLAGFSYSELLNSLESLHITKAKEQYIRQWCRHNKENDQLTSAMNLWLDIVVSDRTFVPSLIGLRQICELLPCVPSKERENMVRRLQVPRFTALDSPKEEWVRARLSIVQALYEIDSVNAVADLNLLYEELCSIELDLDVKTYCLACILSTVRKINTQAGFPINELETNFQRSLYLLLEGSADHFDHLYRTLHIMVDYDIEAAFLVAGELNTEIRRQRAAFTVIRAMLRKHGEKDISKLLSEGFAQIDDFEMPYMLEELVTELNIQEFKLHQSNLDFLLEYVTEMQNASLRSWSLMHLAELDYRNTKSANMDIIHKSVSSWRLEGDLKLKINMGFDLVGLLAKIEPTSAKGLLNEIRDIQVVPAYSLAFGNLGIMYAEILRIAIRSIKRQDSEVLRQNLDILIQSIVKIPAKHIQNELFSKLVSVMYRIGEKHLAEELVRTKVLASIKNMTIGTDYHKAIVECLPIIYEYDTHEARTLAQHLPPSAKDYAWFLTVLWTITQSYLGDIRNAIPDQISVPNDHPRIRRAFEAAQEISSDELLTRSVTVLANTISESYDGHIDLSQALLLLADIEQLIKQRLPDTNNIKHDGYKVLSFANVHSSRSSVFLNTPQNSRRGLKPSIIEARWKEIESSARQIPNVADRVLVMAEVAKAMAKYFRKSSSNLHRNLLEDASQQISDIPTAIDRFERLDSVIESWQKLSDKSKAQLLIEQAIIAANQLEPMSADDRLSAIVQLAHNTIGADFASELISRFDLSRIPSNGRSAQRTMTIEKLKTNPNSLGGVSGNRQERGSVLSTVADKFITDMVAGKNRGIQPKSVFFAWLTETQLCDPSTAITVSNWLVESGHQSASRDNETSLFFDLANLVLSLANAISPQYGEGIPMSIQESFPGLDSKFITFLSGEVEKAKNWVRAWLENNSRDYLKICDPYFGSEQVEFLRWIPANCRVTIITTLKQFGNPNQIEEELRLAWNAVSNTAPPETVIMILPSGLESKFHDRVIVTNGSGLDVGPSLNGLGRSSQKIAFLDDNEALEIEHKYFDPMLNVTKWILDDNITPVFVRLKS